MSEPENDHEITIEVSGDQVKIRAQDDAQETGKFVFEDLAKDTVDIFQNWLDLSKISSQKELQVLGSYLFQALFDEHTRPFLENALREARQNRQRLRVLLSFTKESSDLYSLPWEYMYYRSNSGRSFFLSTQADLVLSRYIAQGSGRKSMAPSDRVLRVLVLVSQPDHPSLGPVVAEPVIEAIQKLAEKYPIQLTIEKKPTVPNLLDKLKRLNPHVIHFIGHGRYNDDLNQGEIAMLANDETSLRPVRDTEFVEYLTQMNSVPKLFLLQMCEGGKVADFKKQFAGMAPQLILAGVDAVVAMQHPISNIAAIAFSRAFYKELGEGNPVDSAVQMGRWQITLEIEGAYDNRVFGTPVLYMHSRDGIILPPSESGKKIGEKSVSRQDQEQKTPETQEEAPERNNVPLPSGASRIIQNQGIATAIPVPATSQSPSSLRINPGTATLTSIPPRLQLSLRRTALEAEGGGLSREEITALLENLPWKTMAPADFCAELDRLAQEQEGMASLVYELMRDELNAWLQSNQ